MDLTFEPYGAVTTPAQPPARRLLITLTLGIALLAATLLVPASGRAATSSNPCGFPVTNLVACENSKQGTPQEDWAVEGNGDDSIQGYATAMSVNAGSSISFKIKTPATRYHVDILRLGYYNGDGARMWQAGIRPSATLPQVQPACLTDSNTGLIDCGNWRTSASWTVPSTAVSGIYIARLVRDDNAPGDDDVHASLIPFVVRNDSSRSDIVVSTSDATWQAYNAYGGNSLYGCTVACPTGDPRGYKAAYAVSYNRPFDGTIPQDGGRSYLWYAEYQMVRFLERNGYDTSYIAQPDIDAGSTLLKNHRTFIASGHDEYWSGAMRTNVENARSNGVNLAFFTGNEVFWKTRYANSGDGTNTPRRTLIAYKDTHFDSPVDPTGTWTGSWRDPRFSPPADGGNPENSLTGQYFLVNAGSADIQVPAAYNRLRFWKNTQVAGLGSGQTLTLSPFTQTLGYEWDVNNDNGAQPAGLFNLSSTTVNDVDVFDDYGTTTVVGPATHNMTMYKAASGARVFGAGTVQWAWGLDDTNAWNYYSTNPSHNPPDINMQQATVNLLADMSAQPLTPMSGIVLASRTTDSTAPTSRITSPANGTTYTDSSTVTVSGTATDFGGTVAGVEVSVDGGSTWHPATGTTSWSYTFAVHNRPSTVIRTRAVDDSGNLESPSSGITLNVNCPCSLWGNAFRPAIPDADDTTPVEVGMKFKSDIEGTVTGVRFYKAAANTGTHVGSLWTADGTRLASVTFTGESATGWQDATFATPVAIDPNTTYVVSYYAPNGHYSASNGYFFKNPVIGYRDIDSAPLHAIAADGGGANGGNGVFTYAAGTAFPTSSYGATNYWVDVKFAPPASVPGVPTAVSATAGPASATVNWTAPASGPKPTSYKVTPYIGTTAQTATTVTGNPLPTSALVPNLTSGTTYTFKVQAVNGIGAGTASASSNSVVPTAATVPPPPTGVTATASSGSVTVNWTPNASNGGRTLTGYTVTTSTGGTQLSTTTAAATATSATIGSLTNGRPYTFTVKASNSLGTGAASDPTSAVVPGVSIFATTSSPAVTDSGDGNAVTLGVKFKADSNGSVGGIRFWKASTNTGTHVGALYKTDGTQLAQATFTGESATGWQQVLFDNPVDVTAGTTYVAAYYAPNGHYSYSTQALTNPVDNAPLHTIAASSDPNGVFGYGPSVSFPSGSTINDSNYWVDVVYWTTVTPGAPSGVTATAGTGSATVRWTAPTTGGNPRSYTITPYLNGTTAQTTTVVSGNPPATQATITGLSPNKPYTFKVAASNTAGTSAQSAASNSVTPTGAIAPDPPTGVAATATSGKASVSWTAPAYNGGSAITGYVITPYVGSTAQPTVSAGASATSATVTGLTDGQSYTFTVKAQNAVGTGTESAASAAVVPQDTIFGFSTPAVDDSGDTGNGVLGVKFTTDVAGQVSGVRFYKSAANTGTHVGALWSSDGTKLAQATFTGETATGWQQVRFASPVAIVPGRTYVASYTAPNGHYAVNSSQLATAVDNAPLHTVADSVSPNGVFTYDTTSGFPNSSWNASNYWVDVSFSEGDFARKPSAPTGVTASSAVPSANVRWTAPSDDGGSPITGYTITPYLNGTTAQPATTAGASATSARVDGLTSGASYTFTVTATNAKGDSPESSPSPSVSLVATLFGGTTPAIVDAGDNGSVVLGMKFKSDVAGQVVGIRFYKAAANTGTHVAGLWSSDGSPIASATFSGESASGWQEADFATPVTISAGTTYVASYLAPNGHYSLTSSGFSTGFDNPPLRALADPVDSNGVFSYSATSVFPTGSYNGSNYWVDVAFAPGS